MAISFVIVALWWMGMSLPLIKKYEQKNYVERKPHAVRESFKRLYATCKNIKKRKAYIFISACIFLLHRWCVYNHRHGNGIRFGTRT